MMNIPAAMLLIGSLIYEFWKLLDLFFEQLFGHLSCCGGRKAGLLKQLSIMILCSFHMILYGFLLFYLILNDFYMIFIWSLPRK